MCELGSRMRTYLASGRTLALDDRVLISGLQVDAGLFDFVGNEALFGSEVDPDRFWDSLAALVERFGPRIAGALEERDRQQRELDRYYTAHAEPLRDDPAGYRAFLTELGYLIDEPEPFLLETPAVDDEIIGAGPQLVVPLLNARFAANAANARWGSLYDALYGTDVIADAGALARGTRYNPERGRLVVDWVRSFLDDHLPLSGASHRDVLEYRADHQGLRALVGGEWQVLRDPEQYVGVRNLDDAGVGILLTHHGLGIEIQVDPSHPVGAADQAGVADVVIESALTVIMDLEDSVAAVDAADKIDGYRNWLHLMQGRLTAPVEKDGRVFMRTLEPDRTYVGSALAEATMPGRALLMVRHVGHHMFTDAVLDSSGAPIPEGILDALVTALASCHDLRGNSPLRNSRQGSIYVVKPKMHGPAEVAIACDVLAHVEEALGLPFLTVKLGIMDEERRTSVNLRACIHAARQRLAFINTGFLDRTGDEIHTSAHAGPVVRKAEMRQTRWIAAYERRNVDAGLACGLRGRAQIGKGMWAAPEAMAQMMQEKGSQLEAGASCAWVPSPTAATLHAIHYHQVDVAERQRTLESTPSSATLDDLLTLPLGDPAMWSAEERQHELDNNVQGVLGYVVRWVEAGVGCSKVPDLLGTPLMEDRATLRISAQHVANWLLHDVVTLDQVEESLRRMATQVDEQNAGDPGYEPMAHTFDNQAFLAARELLLKGLDQPNGYTEPILHRRRKTQKSLHTSEVAR
jgi:malate synthase